MNEILTKELEVRGLPFCRESIRVLESDPRNSGSRNDLLDANFQRAILEGKAEIDRMETNPVIDTNSESLKPSSTVTGQTYLEQYMRENYDVYMNPAHPKHTEVHAQVKRISDEISKAGEANRLHDETESLKTQALLKEQAKAKKKSAGILDL